LVSIFRPRPSPCFPSPSPSRSALALTKEPTGKGDLRGRLPNGGNSPKFGRR
jgi:hypothetical protein